MDDFDSMTDDQLLALYQQEKAKLTGKAPPKLTAGLQKDEDADVLAMQGAANISGDMGRLGSQIESGKLNLGPIKNTVASARNFMGISDENSRNFSSFQTSLEKLRNDSLRLNKGMQTEGDAVRAWNELIKNTNDEKLVQQRLVEIDSINKRALDQKRGMVQSRRKAQNVGPADLSAAELGSIRTPYDLSKGESRTSVPLGSFYRDEFGNVRRNDNWDAGNPKFDPKTGAQIRDNGAKPTNALTGKSGGGNAMTGKGKPVVSGDGWKFVGQE